MAQGNSAQLLGVNGTPTWQGHLTAGAITQFSPLVGGTNYRLIGSTDAAAVWTYIFAGSANDWQYISNLDETGGYPTPAPSPGSDVGAQIIIRCGVQPSGGGGGAVCPGGMLRGLVGC